MNDREELIEEAAKAINPEAWEPPLFPDSYGSARRDLSMKRAEAAFAVFSKHPLLATVDLNASVTVEVDEKAHAPTDNERVPGFAEREKRAARAWEFFARDDREMSHDFRGGYHQGMIDGFRRSEVPEPSAEDEIDPEICKGCDEYDPLALCMASPEPQGEPDIAENYLAVAEGLGLSPDVRRQALDQLAEAGQRVDGAQGEPSDAEILAALNSENPRAATDDLSDWGDWSINRMRTALRAAGGVR